MKCEWLQRGLGQQSGVRVCGGRVVGPLHLLRAAPGAGDSLSAGPGFPEAHRVPGPATRRDGPGIGALQEVCGSPAPLSSGRRTPSDGGTAVPTPRRRHG